MWFRVLAFAFICTVGCESAQKKNLQLVQDRVMKLKPLAAWPSVLCKVEVSLSQPAAARYREMFPKEKLREPWEYTWKAREVACELHGSEQSPMRDSHKTFMETAMCLLLQTHWVNSPFDELKVGPEAITENGDRVQIRFTTDPELGIFLDRGPFLIETNTKTRGAMLAEYIERDGNWVPSRIENHRGGSVLALEEMDYELSPIPGARPTLKSFWIAVGTERGLKHSWVAVRECKP